MLNPMYDPLWVKHVDEIRYYLAESYTVSEDGLEVTVKLRDGMKWHDGEAITADDLIFTLDVCSDTNNGAGGTNVVIIGEEKVTYEKVDELTVKITTPTASASYAELQAMRESLGLTGNVFQQYAAWAQKMMHGNWGISIQTKENVLDLILAKLPCTMGLMGASMVLSLIIAIPLGLIAGTHKNKLSDNII